MNKPRTNRVIDRPPGRMVALDGGTSNTRARLLVDGRIVATARRAIGVRDTVLDAGSARGRLADAVREVIAEVFAHAAGQGEGPPSPDDDCLIVAAGMLSSEAGLHEVPHVVAPAGVAELAGGVVTHDFPEICPWPIHFIPGIRTPAEAGALGWTHADVMRGEECETLGALIGLNDQGSAVTDGAAKVFLWPGSHTKVVEVDGQGRITRSHTTLTGEIIQSVARHTLLAGSLPEELPETLDLPAADAGATAAREEGLARAAFLVRLSALLSTLGPAQRASFWISAVVADDVRHLVRQPMLSAPGQVWVGGREPLRTLYARMISRHHDGRVHTLDQALAEAASALGAMAVVRASLDRQRSGDGSIVAEPAP